MTDGSPGLGHDGVAFGSHGLAIPPAQSTTEKQHKCPQCPASFKRPENLRRHERGHENIRFTCQVCDKSFARSDILGRHVATHVPREGRDQNPHRRRACRECARARARCSRGDPCRRCATRMLGCTYPEESPFRTARPDTGTRSSSVSISDDYDAAESDCFSPSLAAESSRNASSLDHGFPQWQFEDFPTSLRSQHMLSTLPFDPYQSHPSASLSEASVQEPIKYETLSPFGEGLCASSAGDASMANLAYSASSSALFETSELYHQTAEMPSHSISNANWTGAHHPGPSFELEMSDANIAHRVGGFNGPFGTGSSSGGCTGYTDFGQTDMLEASNNPAAERIYDERNYHGVQVPSVDFCNPETHFQTPPCPWST
ncbi:hypothetical protein F4808DRAFT_15127 [Astrocystis sublimbata]|nr:hypothetical protein F4808DRAFT_15127 [Astrocystis sublimbata]